ncbi:unnamed protein product [Camellia sinensis]
MASTSGSRPHGGVGRIGSTATTLFSDNQYLIAEIRKVMITMKEVAVDLERDTESQMIESEGADKCEYSALLKMMKNLIISGVKELEDGLLQLLVASEDCADFSSALQSVGHVYQPGEELTDFKKLFDDEITKSKANSSSIPPNHPLLRQFREAIWNVHHAGQPMPGEEQEDLVMTSTQFNLLNIKCPLTGKPITELEEPVRSSCPRILQAARVACDPLLLVEIEEMRSSTKHSVRPDMVEDFTELDEEDSVRQIGAFAGMEYYFTPRIIAMGVISEFHSVPAFGVWVWLLSRALGYSVLEKEGAVLSYHF